MQWNGILLPGKFVIISKIKTIEKAIETTKKYLAELRYAKKILFYFLAKLQYVLIIESIWRNNLAKYLFLGVWSPGKSYLFLQNFEKALLENLMCSNEILDKISRKFWSVLMIFLPPGKSNVFLQNFEKALLALNIAISKWGTKVRMIEISLTIHIFFTRPRLLFPEENNINNFYQLPLIHLLCFGRRRWLRLHVYRHKDWMGSDHRLRHCVQHGDTISNVCFAVYETRAA